MPTSTEYYDSIITSLNLKIKGHKVDTGKYYDQGIDSTTFKQDKYNTLSDELHGRIDNTDIPLDLVNAKDANGSMLDNTIFGDLYNNGKSQFYFKNHIPPSIII